MPASSPNPPPEDDEWANFDLRQFVLSTIKSVEWDGHQADVLQQQVLRIEECIIAPWPRRWLLWRRLRREIRASVATFDDDYIARDNFIWRRSEYTWQQAVRISEMEHGTRPQRDDDGAQQGGTDPGEGILP